MREFFDEYLDKINALEKELLWRRERMIELLEALEGVLRLVSICCESITSEDKEIIAAQHAITKAERARIPNPH